MRYKVANTAVVMLALGAALYPVTAKEKKVKDFDISETSKSILPIARSPKAGETRQIKEYDAVIWAGVSLDESLRLNADLQFTVGGVAITVPKYSWFAKVDSLEGGDVDGYPDGTKIFCGHVSTGLREAKQTVDKAEKNLRKAVFEPGATACLVDYLGDKTIDGVAIDGLKRREDRRTISIASFEYRPAFNKPLPGALIWVGFHYGNIFNTPTFYVEVRQSAKSTGMGAASMEVQLDKDSPVFTKVKTWQDPKHEELPKRLDFGGAWFTVESMDPKTKIATVTIGKTWDAYPFKYTWTPINGY